MHTQAVQFNGEESQDEEKKGNEQPPLLDRMLKTRTILIAGEINKELAERVVRQLLIMEQESDEDIRVFIDSPGGDADAGYAIFDTIRFVTPQVWTVGIGLVASAGALILLAAEADHRVGFPNSHYLIHQPLSGIRGVATDIEIHAKEIERMRFRINTLIAEETGKQFKQVEKDTDRDFWMNAEEAVAYGLISRITAQRSDL